MPKQYTDLISICNYIVTSFMKEVNDESYYAVLDLLSNTHILVHVQITIKYFENE